MNLTTFFAEMIYKWLFKGQSIGTPPANIYLGLSTQDILKDKTGLAEPTNDPDYVRKLLNFSDPMSTNETGTSGGNIIDLVFPAATIDWGPVSHGFLSDSLSGGDIWLFGAWAEVRNIAAGETWVLGANDFTLHFK